VLAPTTDRQAKRLGPVFGASLDLGNWCRPFRRPGPVIGDEPEEVLCTTHPPHRGQVRLVQVTGTRHDLELFEERPVKVVAVEQCHGFGVEAQLAPRPRFEQLVEGAGSARESHKGVGQLRHAGLALVHGRDHFEPTEAGVAHLALDKETRYDADDLAASGQGSIRNNAHQADPPASVDDPRPAGNQLSGELGGRFRMGGGAERRTDENGNPHRDPRDMDRSNGTRRSRPRWARSPAPAWDNGGNGARCPRSDEMSSPSLANSEDGLKVGRRRLVIPSAELEWRFSASGGPGGQHANTANTRAELVFDIAGSGALTARQRALLLERLGSTLRVVVSDERSQARNRQLALERMAERLDEALRVERPRHPTVPTRASRERRLRAKQLRSTRKRDRRPPPLEG
jgi:ribosome-associated protein